MFFVYFAKLPLNFIQTTISVVMLLYNQLVLQWNKSTISGGTAQWPLAPPLRGKGEDDPGGGASGK